MHFGDTVREILTASCGRDMRDASPRTPLPALDSPATLRTLAANLEVAFGIELGGADLAQLHTVRDVLQCVRLRRWEQTVSSGDAARPAAPRATRPIFVAPTRDPRERFIRYTARPAAPVVPSSPAARAASSKGL
jgi:hypothetical protein